MHITVYLTSYVGNIIEELVSPEDKINYQAMSFGDMARVIRNRGKGNEDLIMTSKRESVKRTKTIEIEGVGSVEVLHQNDYSLEDGEPSVMQRELRNAKVKREEKLAAVYGENSLCFVPSVGKQQAGRDFVSIDIYININILSCLYYTVYVIWCGYLSI